MSHFFFRIRYALEVIAVPFFILLVVHIAGHGAMFFLGEDHSHEGEESLLNMFFSLEGVLGAIVLVFSVWAWHRPAFKKWVPCQHEHCHTEHSLPHVLALLAFVLHFFPESAIRAELFSSFSSQHLISIAGIVGFFSHFLVDFIVALLISSYWRTPFQKILSFGGIAIVWGIALWGGVQWEDITHRIPEVFQGIVFLLSAFFLSMFIHFPHQEKACHSCEHEH